MTDELKTIVRQIDGWLTDNEAALLYELARKTNLNGIIAEIGSWQGKSTVCLGKGSLEGPGNRIYAIDPHNIPSDKLREYIKNDEVSTYNFFLQNIKRNGVEEIITPIIDYSYNAVEKILDEIVLIFIDGSHSYEDVLNDYNLFFPKVRVGGIMAFHDTNNGGPYKVVVEKLFKGNRFRKVKFIDSITYAEKTDKATILDLFKNRYNYILFIFYNKYRTKKMPRIFKNAAKSMYNIIIKNR